MVTTIVVYLFTKEMVLSLGIGIIDAGIKMFIYYAHERFWDRISFGRKKEVKEDYMI